MSLVRLVGQLARPPVVRVAGPRLLAIFTLAVLEARRADAAFTLYVPCVAWGPRSGDGALAARRGPGPRPRQALWAQTQ